MGGGGPSALPPGVRKRLHPQTFGHSQTYGGRGGAERARDDSLKAGAGGWLLRRAKRLSGGERMSCRSPGFNVIVGMVHSKIK